MKKRLTALVTAFALVAVMCISVAGAAEIMPRYEPCSCGGYIGTVQSKVGETYNGLVPCPSNPRYNCPQYTVEYQVLKQCSSCGRIYDINTTYKTEIRHNHSGSRAIW